MLTNGILAEIRNNIESKSVLFTIAAGNSVSFVSKFEFHAKINAADINLAERTANNERRN